MKLAKLRKEGYTYPVSDKEYIPQLEEQPASQVQQIKLLKVNILLLLEQIQRLGIKIHLPFSNQIIDL